MADSKDSLKRQNYFDLKRDEFMAMDEYLQSPISEIDLRKMNEGGVASIENMTGPIGMAKGGDPMVKEMDDSFTTATKNAMKEHPFQTSFYLEMGFDKLFDILSSIPMMKDGGPIGMAAGGPIPPEDSVLEKLKKNDPDKELRDTGVLPPLREKEGETLLSSGMHPLVVFKEMHDAYKLDGGTMDFKEFFDMIQMELNNEASS